ncbi:MAG: FecR domain-containing protein [Deltaproteobacteria bacterium]|nr:FecR domain-containing protein [Deltaproteobacteria bacterium]
MMLDLHRPPNEEELRRLGSGAIDPGTAARITHHSMQRLPRGSPVPWAQTIALASASLCAGLLVSFLALRSDPPSREVTPLAPALASSSPTTATAGMVIAAGEESRDATILRHLVQVAPHASVRVERAAAGQVELSVLKGSSRFAVEHLREHEGFRVRVGTVLIEVVGTRFDVATDGICSVVGVSEGRVRVTSGGVREAVSQGERKTFCPPESVRHGLSAHPGDEPGTELVREALVLISAGKELEEAATLLERYRSEHREGVFAEDALFHLCILELRRANAARARELAAEFRRRFPNTTRNETLDKLLKHVGSTP